ncbi:hypothetical protein TKK_0019335 [Trichogramma kaykai]
MSGFSLRAFVALAVLMIVCVSIGSAGPGKHWHSDSRCTGPGGSTGHARIGRGLGRNGGKWFGGNGGYQSTSTYYVFNPNYESCETRYGEPPKNPNYFKTMSDCQRVCLDIYHA